MTFRLLGHKEYSKNRLLNIKNFAYLAILGICIQFATSFLLGVILDMMPAVRDEYLSHIASFSTLDIAVIFLTAIAAPIYEELLFRGVIYFVLGKIMPPVVAIMAQAVLFGIYHGNIVQCVYAVLLGLIIGHVRYTSGNIVSTIILHMMINATGLALSYIPVFANAEPLSPIVVICAIAAMAVATFVCIRLNRIWNYSGEENIESI